MAQIIVNFCYFFFATIQLHSIQNLISFPLKRLSTLYHPSYNLATSHRTGRMKHVFMFQKQEMYEHEAQSLEY